MVDAFLPDDQKVTALRELLPATGAGIYLDVASAGPLPAETSAALAEADEWELRVGRGGMDRRADLEQRDAEARAVLAALLAADPDDIVITHGARDGRLRLSWCGIGPAAGHPIFDASSVAGAEALAVGELGVDAVVLDGHRWLLGPQPSGAVWLAPRLRSYRSAVEEAGDQMGRRQLLGLARSVGWLEMYVGLPWIYRRTASLAGYLSERLSAIPGVELAAAADAPPAAVLFEIRGWPSASAAEELSHRVQAILGLSLGGERVALRASVGCWNTTDELDRFAAGVALLAAHAPGALPARAGLIILGSTGEDGR